jgi:hypothetical protein
MSLLVFASVIFYFALFKIIIPIVTYTQKLKPKGKRAADSIKAEMAAADMKVALDKLDRQRAQRSSDLEKGMDTLFTDFKNRHSKT